MALVLPAEDESYGCIVNHPHKTAAQTSARVTATHYKGNVI